MQMNEVTAQRLISITCRVFGPWREGAVQQVETGELEVLQIVQCANECADERINCAQRLISHAGCLDLGVRGPYSRWRQAST